MSASIQKQPVGKDPIPVTARGQHFYLDYGFMRASTDNYSRLDKSKDRVILSYDG